MRHLRITMIGMGALLVILVMIPANGFVSPNPVFMKSNPTHHYYIKFSSALNNQTRILVPIPLSARQSIPIHGGIVSFDQKTYRVGDTVTVTVNDSSLNTDKDLVVVYSPVQPVGALGSPQDPATDTVGQAGLGTYSDGTPIGMLFDIKWGQQDRRWSNSDVPTNKITASCWDGTNSNTGTPGGFATGLAASGFSLAETAAGSGVFQGTFEVPDQVCQSGAAVSTVGQNIKASYYFRDESGKPEEAYDNAGIRGNPSGVRLVSVSTDRYVYMPGDVVSIKGRSYLNDTGAKISLEENNKIPVMTRDIPINKNGTFYASFTIPFDTAARSWWLATTVGGGTLSQGIPFKSGSIPPLDQFWSGILPNDTLCKPHLTLIIKTKDITPACVKPDTAQKLVERGWALPVEIPPTIEPHVFPHMNTNDTGTMTIKNQTFYFTTLNDTLSSYHGVAAIPFPFHNVNFTLFPSVFSAGPPGSCGDTNFGSEVKFSDGMYEKLAVHIPGPPCIENYTETEFTNHQNQQAGLEDYYGKIRLLVSEDDQTSVQLTSCDIPYAPKAGYQSPLYHNGTIIYTYYIPVFYMPMNSAGKLCVHYSDWNPLTQFGIRFFEANDLDQDAKTITTSASQDTIPAGNSTVAYTINSGNKAGFYGMSFDCGGMPFAIGYDNQSRIIRDDFPWIDQQFNCGIMSGNYEISGLHGIAIYYITAVTHEQLSYGIPNTTVTSTHPTATSQNVTFSLHLHTFDKPMRFWFDYKDSNISKFMTNPGFKQTSNPCNWDVTFNNDILNTPWLRLGGIQVNEKPLTLPPYSNGTYTFSVSAKNLSDGYYGLNPVVYGAPPDTQPENAGTNYIAYNYPITIGLHSNIDSSGVCSR